MLSPKPRKGVNGGRSDRDRPRPRRPDKLIGDSPSYERGAIFDERDQPTREARSSSPIFPLLTPSIASLRIVRPGAPDPYLRMIGVGE